MLVIVLLLQRREMTVEGQRRFGIVASEIVTLPCFLGRVSDT